MNSTVSRVRSIVVVSDREGTTNVNEGGRHEVVQLEAAVADQLSVLRTIEDELVRAQSALRLMLEADALLKAGADDSLIALGFSNEHVADLRRRAGSQGGYPPYSLRNIKQTILMLQLRRRSVASALAVASLLGQ